MKKLFFVLWFCLCVAPPALAALDPTLVEQLAADDSDDKIAAIQALAQSADPAALKVLKAMNEEALLTDGERVFIKDGERAIDAASGAEIAPAPANADAITINNRVRNELAGAMATLKLFDDDRAQRLAAVRELATAQAGDPTPAMAPLLAKALA